ncbi:MAG: hypothetical protein GX118_06280 [Arcobacter butzleri]|jgi:hypothetical protein|nr:hypothetical protein [Arcobacteraceae bacterium]MDY0364609.1 hypothetical protein [Arcobacteraceae bacterium]NLO17782.1 hypothetical protein [Aliarcobacter butzleri]
MIKKLYNLKTLQADQKIIEKLKLQNQIYDLENEINSLKDALSHTSVNRYGPISDFAILEIHKATLKDKITIFEIQKSNLYKLILNVDVEIANLQKESEQFKYILNEEKKKKIKQFLKDEDIKADEYMQTKMIMLSKE